MKDQIKIPSDLEDEEEEYGDEGINANLDENDEFAKFQEEGD